MTRIAALALLLALAVAAPAAASPTLVKVGDFMEPTYATSPPGDANRLFVTEKPGRVRLVVDGTLQTQPFLDLSTLVLEDGQERGLLSIAFPPDYAISGRFYLYMTVAGGVIQIREYQRSAADPDVADPTSARIIASIPHPDAANHNGGQLQFGPDGKLYAGTGDGGGANNQFHHSQDPASLLGKLLRFDPAQAAPVAEVLARGLRNPWRFSFDRETGQLVIADVGQDNVEEVDVGLAANYGWPCLEGTRANVSDPGCAGVPTAAPVLQRNHADGVCSIVGGYVVRDPGLPTLLGRYLYGDFCQAALRSADLTAPSGDAPVAGLSVSSLSSFGEDACGRLLAVSLAGPVYRIVDGTPSPCTSAPATPPPTRPPADTRACALSARVTGLHSAAHRHRLSVALRADEACAVTVSARVRGVTGFTTAKRALASGKRSVITLWLTKHAAAAVRSALRRHRALTVTLKVRAVDRAGNVRTLTRSVRITG